MRERRKRDFLRNFVVSSIFLFGFFVKDYSKCFFLWGFRRSGWEWSFFIVFLNVKYVTMGLECVGFLMGYIGLIWWLLRVVRVYFKRVERCLCRGKNKTLFCYFK